ncbi:MAG: amino acid ABC transporter permease [Lachnospiraceae bacterium]|nr:amino acid ABC transporter permease [Lachnospiraceae bacterium]MBR2996136.1 amino acid ABC transporter permease [Lachnospiraceae bacterium]
MSEFTRKFYQDFIQDNRWHFITDGLKITLLVTLLALLIGTLIGIVVGIVRCAHDQQTKNELRGVKGSILKALNLICKVYVTIIRGTPALVQLLIMYFVILVTARSKVFVAVLTFGINSGAYVAEIFRGGIMSIDKGQMEAGRSLGLSYVQTMYKIILPQAFKAVLPSLVNEFISLLKETSICGYIGLNELTRGGDIIRGTTFDAMLPLFTVAIIYLTLVLLIQGVAGRVEKRLRKSDVR